MTFPLKCLYTSHTQGVLVAAALLDVVEDSQRLCTWRAQRRHVAPATVRGHVAHKRHGVQLPCRPVDPWRCCRGGTIEVLPGRTVADIIIAGQAVGSITAVDVRPERGRHYTRVCNNSKLECLVDMCMYTCEYCEKVVYNTNCGWEP